VVQYSPLLEDSLKKQVQTPGPQNIKSLVQQVPHALSELPLFLNGTFTLDVPVYTVWGACEDVRVLEKFRSAEYKVPNLHIIDEANSRLLDVGGLKLRLLGLGGAVVMHKLFDNGEGKTTIAGGQGTMWTTLLQMGDLVDTANRVYDIAETRIFITHNSPAREGLLNQLSVTLKADLSISAGLHFRYGSSYNEFSVNPSLDYYRGKLVSSKASFNDVWETVKGEVQPAVEQSPHQRRLLENALAFIEKMPTNANGGNPFGGPSTNNAPGAGQVDESAFKNMWNFNLADAAFGWLVLEIEGGRIGSEMKSQGFNFSHRVGKQPYHAGQQVLQSSQVVVPPATPTVQTPIIPAVPLGPKKSAPTPVKSTPPPPTGPSPRIEPAVPMMKPATPCPAPVVTNRAPTPAAPEPSSPEEPKPANGNLGAQAEEARDATAPTTGHPSNLTTTAAEGPNYRSNHKYGLHVQNATAAAAVRELIPENLHNYIVDIQEKTSMQSRVYFLVYTETEEQAREILSNLPKDLTVRSFDRDDNRVHFKLQDNASDRRGYTDHRSSRGGGMDSSKWGRGLGGNTSESDNAPGRRRGNYSGRGGPRGQGFERGAGRGGRGGRRGGRLGEGGEVGGAPAQTE